MNTRKALGLMTALCVLAAATAVRAQEKPTPTFKIRVTAEQANIRDTPDIGSPVVQLVPEGTVLEAEKKDGEWYLVLFTRDSGLKARGYIHESLVQPIDAVPVRPAEEVKIEPVPKIEEKPEPKPESKPEAPARSGGTPAARPPASRSGMILPPEERTFSLAILTGGNFAAVGDLNTGAKGFADYYAAVLGSPGNGSVGGVHLAYVLGAELSYHLMRDVYLFLGLDYFGGHRSSAVRFGEGSDETVIRTRPRVRALPIRIGVAYYPLPYLYVKGSLQYYFANCNYLYRYEKDLYWQEWQGDAKARGLGAAAGVGGEWEFYPGLYLVGEAELHFARFGGFKGKNITLNSEGESYSEQGKLYAFMSRTGGSDFPLVFIRSEVPVEANVSDPREARVNFNGASLKVGIRVRF